MQSTPPIKPEVWRKTFAICSLFFALGIAITCILLIVLFHKPAGANYSDSFLALSRFRDELVSISLFISCGGLLLTLTGIVFITVVYSHRIAGPAFRLSVVSRMASTGSLDQHAHFRKKDFIQPMAEEMNGMLRHYSALMEQLQVAIASADNSVHGPPPADRAGAALSTKLDEIETILSHYKV